MGEEIRGEDGNVLISDDVKRQLQSRLQRRTMLIVLTCIVAGCAVLAVFSFAVTKFLFSVDEIDCPDTSYYTAEEIFEKAKQILPSISRATVYNNLNALASEHLIRRICLADADVYDRCFEPHVHLICEKCGGIKDMRLDGLAETLESALGQSVSSYEFKVEYICDGCRRH